MRFILISLLLAIVIVSSCNKQSISPVIATNTGSGSTVINTPQPSNITVFINQVPMAVNQISYNRGGSTFNFTAKNSLQRVDVYCFQFYQQSGFSYQFSDSINYSTRNDSLSAWKTTRATNWGDVNFDCCNAPLTDTIVDGNYTGDFGINKSNIVINGNFHLRF